MEIRDAYVGGVNPNYITSSTDAGIVIATSSPATIEGNVLGKSMTKKSIVAGMSNLYSVHVKLRIR
ncbi:MAG: hypothetical protein IPG07_11310 [Crocinitomicaceae bacterium]|nr:hypothetical protein [Crocinitomicaceae bacterium]